MPLINEENRIAAQTIEEAEDGNSVMKIQRRLIVENRHDEALHLCHGNSPDPGKEISMESSGWEGMTVKTFIFSPLQPHPSCIIDGAHAVSASFHGHHPFFRGVMRLH